MKLFDTCPSVIIIGAANGIDLSISLHAADHDDHVLSSSPDVDGVEIANAAFHL